MTTLQRLGRNQGGYFGETIDIDAVLNDISFLASERGWTAEVFGQSSDWELSALRLTTGPARRTVYLSAGMHGDEPAGPLAVRQLVRDHAWPEGLDIWLCPCLNPSGFRRNRRENADGIDLNRDYLSLQAEEIRTHVAWLDRQPRFEAAFCLHEDWESLGFYLYELNPDRRPSLAPAILDAVKTVCPIDLSAEIEGRPANEGLIQPPTDVLSRPQWPEAFYLLKNKTRLSYTLEAPSDFPLLARTAALTHAIQSALREFVRT